MRAEEEEAEREEEEEEAARVGEDGWMEADASSPLFVCAAHPSDPALIGPRRLTADVRTWSALGADVDQVVMQTSRLKPRSEGAARLTISSFSKHAIPIMQEVI